MTSDLKKDLAAYLTVATFRANQNYELVLFDRLPPEQQEMFAELQNQPDFYGILRPRESSGLSIKSVSQETALLYLSLLEPGRLPSYVRERAGENYETTLAKLVIDQVLEVKDSDQFVSGAQAYNLFFAASALPEASSRIGRLSIAALQYGQALAMSDIMELSMRLYNYQRLPVSSHWLQKFAGSVRVAQVLGVDSQGRHRHLLAKHWQSLPILSGSLAAHPGPRETGSIDAFDAGKSSQSFKNSSTETAEEGFAGWLSWNSRHVHPKADQEGDTYKLYISPLPDFIEEVFDIALKTLATTPAFHFKVGADVLGLLRPDKMVAYFSSLEDLQTASNLLAKRLEGCPSHGVPFTAEICGEGLLSWGVDPPESEQLLSWQPRESWRLWLTNRLANALLTAKNAPRVNGENGLEPWQYALQRLRLEGVDTQSWTLPGRSGSR